MKNIMLAISLAFVATTASADYTMIVPQKVGGGTSVWAEIVAKQLEKHLGEPIVIDYRPGARDIPGF
jgi:tripartite-type tricarboxylate transporter receptor subunit TctC